MPLIKDLKHLHAAIAEESATVHCIEDAYKRLLQKIVDYQIGIGDAPTDRDFTVWRDAAQHRADLAIAGLTPQTG